MTNAWHCLFCDWKINRPLDFGLIEAHLYTFHREEGIDLIPRELLRRSERHHYICSLPHNTGETWQIAWDFDMQGNDPDIGLIVIARHIETCHPEAIYGSFIPASVVTKLRRKDSATGVIL